MKPILSLLAFLLGSALCTAGFARDVPMAFPKRDYESFIASLGSGSPVPVSPRGLAADSPREDWQALQAGRISASTIRYRSGSHAVTGFLLQPRLSGKKLPVLIWARGGIGDIAQGEGQLIQMASWVRRGYIVIGSNYRGAAGSEGKDEFAGDDVDDILALLPTIRALPNADAGRLYALGFSRGGTMLYRAVAAGLPVKAFVTVGGVTNLAQAAKDRPDLGETFKRMMPDFAAEEASGFCRRSAICWAEKISVPLMIVHGGKDQVIRPEQALQLATGLEKAGRPYRLLMFGQGDHGLNGYRQKLFDAADRYFREESEQTRETGPG